RILCDADTDRELWQFRVFGKAMRNSIGNEARILQRRFWQDEGEFVATVSRRHIDFPAVDAQHVRHTAQSAAANDVPVGVVDLLQTIEIEQEDGKRTASPVMALDLRIEAVEEMTVVGETGERITDRQESCLLLLTMPLGHFRGEHERHHRLKRYEPLQQKQ